MVTLASLAVIDGWMARLRAISASRVLPDQGCVVGMAIAGCAEMRRKTVNAKFVPMKRSSLRSFPALSGLLLVAALLALWLLSDAAEQPRQEPVHDGQAAAASRVRLVAKEDISPLRSIASAGRPDPGVDEVCIFVREMDAGPLVGVESHLTNRQERLRRKGATPIAISDDTGWMCISTKSLNGPPLIGFCHPEYLPETMEAGVLVPGQSYEVSLVRGHDFEVQFRCPKGNPVEGVGLVLSRQAVFTKDLEVDLEGVLPSPVSEWSVHYGVSGKDGIATIKGIAPGSYMHDIRAPWMYPVLGEERDWGKAFSVPQSSVVDIMVLSVYASVVKYVGDEVLSTSAEFPAAPVSMRRHHVQMEKLKSDLSKKYPGSEVAVGVPSLSQQMSSEKLTLDWNFYGATSGWGSVPVDFVPYPKAVLHEVPVPQGSSDLRASVQCRLVSPRDRQLQIPLAYLMSVAAPRAPDVYKLIPSDGSVVSVPIGDYAVGVVSPFLGIAGGKRLISLRPGDPTSFLVETEFDLVEVEPHVIMASGERPTLVKCAFIDNESRIKHGIDVFTIGQRILLPANRPLACEIWIPGVGRRHMTTRIDRAPQLTGIVQLELRIPE